jgi:hypothetical protein
MFRLILNKRVAVVIIALAVLLVRPVPVLANDGCNLLSLIFGGDCVSTLDAGVTERTEIREGNETERVELRQDGKTDRVMIEQTQETQRVQLEQMQETQRVQLEQMQETQRTIFETEAMRAVAQEQTTQVLANALAAQNNVDRIAAATENIVLYQAQYDLLQQQAKRSWLDKAIWYLNTFALIILLSGAFVLAYIRRRAAEVQHVSSRQPYIELPDNHYHYPVVRVTREVNHYDESAL